MKLKEILNENITSGGSIAGNRGLLFKQDKMLRRRKQVNKVKVIRYKNENNWNIK